MKVVQLNGSDCSKYFATFMRVEGSPDKNGTPPAHGITATSMPTFAMTFAPRAQWPPREEFANAIMDRSVFGSGWTTAAGSNRIVAQPGTPPLKSLLPQCPFKVTAALYSPALRAWFLSGENKTFVATRGRRVVLPTEVDWFLRHRLLAGRDGEPWEIPINDLFPPQAHPYLAGYPVRQDAGKEPTHRIVPVKELIDRLVDLANLGLGVGPDGSLFVRAR